MKQIYRLLDLGETRLGTDEYLNLAFEWKSLSADNRFTPGQPQTEAHHPTRRRETVLVAGDDIRIGLTAAALTGLCADQKLIEHSMQMIAGGTQHLITDVIAGMAVRFGDATLKRMEENQ